MAAANIWILLLVYCQLECGLMFNYTGFREQHKTVPQDIPKNAERINLNKNEIEQISSSDFVGFSLLKTVLLGQNSITTISPDAFSGSPVTTLDLDYNEITTFPHLVHLKRTLRTLRMYRNSITNLSPSTIIDYPKLIYLGLSLNPIRNFPNLTIVRDTLKTLGLMSCQLSVIPSNYFEGFTKLTELYLGKNDFVELPDFSFRGLTSLTRLFLTECNKLRRTHPETFSGLTSLNILTLEENSALQTTPVLKDCLLLDIFHLTHSTITDFPVNFAQLYRLRGFDMSANKIQSIPKDVFRKMTQLSTVRLQDNNIRCIDNETLDGLKGVVGQLPLSGNRMENFSVSTCNSSIDVQRNLAANLPSLSHLDLSNNLLTVAPNVSLMPRLKILQLNKNRLTRIPNGAFANNVLQILHLEQNQLTGAPSLGNSCRYLQKLHISSNRITSIPDNYFNGCNVLGDLNLAGNLLTSMTEITKIGGSLRHLYLHSNKLTKVFRNDFLTLNNLMTLTLSNNFLTEFDMSILTDHPSLIKLNLNNNQIKALQNPFNWCVGQTCKLLELTIQDNLIPCDETLCWAKRYPGYMKVNAGPCPSPWKYITMQHLACPDIFEMEVKHSISPLSAMFKSSLPAANDQIKLFSNLPSVRFCAFWCVEKGCNEFKHSPFRKDSEYGECMIFLKQPYNTA